MNKPEFQDSLGRTLAHICRMHYARTHALLESLGLYRGQPPLLFALWHQDGLTHSESGAPFECQARDHHPDDPAHGKSGFCRETP